MKNISLLILGVFLFVSSSAQLTPEITSWIQTPGQNGYLGIAANVQQVNYNATDVYITCTCIPGYDIGPWAGNPNVPANQNFCFKITRNPQQNTGTPVNTPLGHIGVWTNGVSLFNVSDAMSYNNQNVWFRNAYFFEGPSFDDCLGHPQQQGEYHTHVNPTCLYDDQITNVHSPIIGYAFDGFPIYGAYAYTNTNGTGSIKGMTPSYRTRTMTDRTTLPNGSIASSVGPAINGQYPLGAFIQDFEYVNGLGDLDEHNGRFAVTPDYPNGIYAYYVTIDSNQNPIYPYLLGPTYYGIVPAGNTGMQSGHNTITGGATLYNPSTGFEETIQENLFKIFPNPSNRTFFIHAENISGSYNLELFDSKGSVVLKNYSSGGLQNMDASNLQQGIYLLRITTEAGLAYSFRLTKN